MTILDVRSWILDPRPKTQDLRSFFNSRGLALVVVLWILTFLSVIFTTFTFAMRTELTAAGNFREEALAYHLAEAGVYQTAAELINADSNPPPNMKGYDVLRERWRANPAAHQHVALGQGSYSVTLADEESKIALNGPLSPAYDAMLRRLLSNSGVRDERILSTIVDSIQDWRDTDDLHRLSGAEDDYYLSLPTPYRAKNADFEAIDELLLVKGMTPEILYGNIARGPRRDAFEAQMPWEQQLQSGEYLGVAQHLTVFTIRNAAGQVSPQINVNTAAPEVLMTLGLTSAETKTVLDRRALKPFVNAGEFTGLITGMAGGGRRGSEVVGAGQPGAASPPQLLATLGQMATVTSNTFSVESIGQLAGSRITSRVVAILQNVQNVRGAIPGRVSKLQVKLWSVDPRRAGA